MKSLHSASALFALFTASLPAAVLFVADAGAGTISTVTPAGTVTGLIAGLANPRALAFQGGLWLVADGDQIRRFDASSGAELSPFAAFVGVESIVVDLLGNVFAASSTLGSVTRFSAGGSVTASVALDTPGALALDDQGRLFVALIDGANGMQGWRYSAADLTFVDVFISSGLNTPMAATYQGGTLYLADLFNGVDQVDSAGLVTTFASTNLSFPWGLAFDKDGNLYVANSSDGFIHVFDPAGTFQSSLASGFVTPTGIAFSPVPEPATLALFGSAVAALVWRRRSSRMGSATMIGQATKARDLA